MHSFKSTGNSVVLVEMLPVFVGLWLFFVNPNITNKVEQRVTIKFLARTGRSPIDTWRALNEVWGEQTLSKHKFSSGIRNSSKVMML